MRKIVAFAAVSLLATPAFAQSASPRVEVHAGYDNFKLAVDVDGFDVSDSADGLVYGGEVGLDFAVGTLLKVGPYAGVNVAETDACEVAADYEECLKSGRDLQAGLRLTAGITDRISLFAKAGYSNGRLVYNYSETGYSEEDAGNRDGFHVGAGALIGLGTNLYGKLEATHTNYNGEEVPDFDLTVDGSRTNLLAGIGIRF